MTNEPAIARKTGEGFDRPNGDSELPIDINYRKIAEWLVGRQKLSNDWHKRVQAIQLKMNEAVKEVPAEVLAKAKGGPEAPLDYFRAKEISTALNAKAERTMFGGLTGPAAVWDKIVKAYEKGYVWVGEAAQTMLQNADYEIPYLQKQAGKLDSQVADYERKHAEYLKSASQCAATYKLECASIGIEGRSLRSELAQLTNEQLPQKFADIVETLKGGVFDDAFKYYSAFTQFVHGEGAVASPLLPILSEVHWGKTEPPKDAASSAASNVAPTTADVAIDWDVIDMGTELEGDSGGGLGAGVDNIDWGISAEGGDSSADAGAAPAIEWDLDLDMVMVGQESPTDDAAAAAPEVSWDIDASAGEADDGGEGINWDIAMTDAGAADAAGPTLNIDWDLDPSEVEAESEKQKHSLAESGAEVAQLVGAGTGASSASRGQLPAAVLRLERDAEYRSLLQDDLQELRAFLVQRRTDLSSSGSSLLSTLLPENIQSVDASQVSAMIDAGGKALAVLTADRLRQLLLIATSKRYLDRLVNNLQRKAGQEAKMLVASKEVEVRQRESKASLVALAPKVKEMVVRTQATKDHVEQTLSALFAGRKVNILGDINTVLAML